MSKKENKKDIQEINFLIQNRNIKAENMDEAIEKFNKLKKDKKKEKKEIVKK